MGNPLLCYDAIATAARDADPPLIWQWSTWVALVLDAPEPVLFVILLFLLFPDGQVPSGRWRPLLWTGVTAATLFVLVMAVATPPWQLHATNRDDFFGPAATVILVFLLVTPLLVLLGAAASVLVRLRQTHGLERQQLRWLAASASLVAVGLALAAFLPWDEGLGNWLRVLPLHLGVVGVIVGAGLAVLRYRLYDLDLVVSRAVLLATATAFLGAGYVTVVVIIGRLLPGAVSESFWPSLLATAVVALAFQPLRRRTLRFADRLAYGPRAAPYEALARFARRLQEAPSPTDLLQQVAAAIGEAVGARRTTAVLELPGHGDTWSTWPVSDALGPGRDRPPVVFPIEDRGDRLGRLELVTPPGVSLRAHETALVDRLLAQSAVALRNLRLETELATHVAELGRRTEELEASRRRIVVAGDEEKELFSQALRSRVLPHVAPLPERLTSLGRRWTAGPDGDLTLQPERDAATEALEELRLLVHGMAAERAQRAAVSQAAVSRSGPNADLVT